MTAVSGTTRAALRAAGLEVDVVCQVVDTALAEDLRYGPDATTEATVPAGAVAVGVLAARSAGVLAGGPVALAVLDAVLGPDYEVGHRVPDGATVGPHEPALVIRGNARGLLTAERTMLNLVCHLSGIATLTASWVAELAGTATVVRDSRKTLPGLRALQKYAVRCGGGTNHRSGLGDAVLIKDNHVEAAGSLTAAITAVRAKVPHLRCEVEVDTLTQLAEALRAGVDEILLDNFSPEQCEQAVELVRAQPATVRLEASGGLTLEHARRYAKTGVDFLAVGALTHSAPALDVGLDLQPSTQQGKTIS